MSFDSLASQTVLKSAEGSSCVVVHDAMSSNKVRNGISACDFSASSSFVAGASGVVTVAWKGKHSNSENLFG